MDFQNVYDDEIRAASYAKLAFPGTYYLAYRDLTDIIHRHARGKKAVDFGCGTGRSTRFLKAIGYHVIGIDVSPMMVQKAKAFDPAGDYRVVHDGNYGTLGIGQHDLILSVFTFDNIQGVEHRSHVLTGLRSLINDEGVIILLDSTPEIYTHEWVSFSTKDFPENRDARSGERVNIVMTDVDDKRPVQDIRWFHDDYIRLFRMVNLSLTDVVRPLGREDEAIHWVSETIIPPWVIYVLKKIPDG